MTSLADHLDGTYDLPDPWDEDARAKWEIQSDDEAATVLRRLARTEAELKRLRDEAQLESDRIASWLADATAGEAMLRQMLEEKLSAYYQRLAREAEGQMPKTHKLRGGSIGVKKNPDALDVREDGGAEDFVRWALVQLAHAYFAASHHSDEPVDILALPEAALLNIKPVVSAVKDHVTGKTPPTWGTPEIERDAKGNPTQLGQVSRVVTDSGEVIPGVSYRVGADRPVIEPTKR